MNQKEEKEYIPPPPLAVVVGVFFFPLPLPPLPPPPPSSSSSYKQTRGGLIGRASDSRSKDPRFKPRQEHKKKLWVFLSQNVVLTRCRCTGPTLRVYTHAQEWSRMHIKNPVVHVRVWWIMETRKDPECTCRTGYRCSSGCCSLTQVRHPKFPQRDN